LRHHLYAPRLQPFTGRDQEIAYVGQHSVEPIGSVGTSLAHQSGAFGLGQQILHSVLCYYRLSIKIHKL
jgi:hypothetical protein